MAAAPVPPMPLSPMPDPAPLSQGARIVDTFIAPSKTFTDIRRSAQWWAPFLLMAILSSALVYIAGQKIGFTKIVENQMQASPKGAARYEKLTPEQQAQQIKWTGVSYYIFIPVITVIIWLIVAALEFGTLKLVANADLTYSKSLAVVVYGGLPLIFKHLLAIVTVFAGASPDGFTFQNPVATNPAYFMNPADGAFLYGMASSLDVFLIWTLILTSIGFTVVAKVKASTAYIVVFGWWAVLSLAGAAIGAAFS